ncbi:tachylectin-related carbohydrate-binding protein [Paractinoplanes rhizophilus]|uniref:Tachylectin-related carbohydrate-binding protein n=1 Tax=Paractinoplanes rhizophilus TaxID=1416877 RepID=A0ABW2HWL7_9ACTN
MHKFTGAPRRLLSLAIIAVLAITAALVATAGPASAARTKNLVLNGQHGNFALITPNGDLYIGYRTGWATEYLNQSSWIGPVKRGEGWDRFSHVAMVGVGMTYDNLFVAIDTSGSDAGVYVYYWHQGTLSWDGPRYVAALSNSGWSGVSKLISGGHGTVIPGLPAAAYFYTITGNGDLYWHRWDGDYYGGWNTTPKVIGGGWGGFPFVTAMYDGTFWAAQTDGQLLWYQRHAVAYNGGDYWMNDGAAKVVGSGWYGGPCGFQTVLSGGSGVIHAVDSAGRLRYFRHPGSTYGTPDWDPVPLCGATIGTGWM